MEKKNTAIRLKEIMDTRGLRQIDILNLTTPFCKTYNVKMNKSDISQYCSGKTEPNQEKLFILGSALNVSEAWLMGYDVPIERNDYEDPTLIIFDAKFDDAWNVLEKAGYVLSLSDDSNKDIIIKRDTNEIIACMHDYELVNKYESLRRKGSITADLLLEDKEAQYIIDKVYAFDCQLKSLGWTYKIMIEPYPVGKKHGVATALFKNNDISFKATMDDCNSFINDAESFFKERLQQLLKKSMKQMFTEKTIDNKSHTEPQAAHERTDIEVTEEMRKHDDDIMDDDNFWNK